MSSFSDSDLGNKPCVFCYKITDNNCDGSEEQKVKVARRFFSATEQLFHDCHKKSSSAKLFTVHNHNNYVNLCGNCFKIVDSFCSLYHKLKCLELQLNWKLEILKNVMEVADGEIARVNCFREGMMTLVGSEEIEILMGTRVVLMKQWSTHLSKCVPRLILAKCDVNIEPLKSVVDPFSSNHQQQQSTSSPVQNEVGDLQKGRAFFVGWIFSFGAVFTLLFQDSVVPHEVSSRIRSNRVTETEDQGDENVDVQSEFETESMEVPFQDDYDEEDSALRTSESSASFDFEVKYLPAVSIHPTQGTLSEEVGTSAKANSLIQTAPHLELKLKSNEIEICAAGAYIQGLENSEDGTTESKPHRRRLRTTHKCPICHATFSSLARFNIHKECCRKDGVVEEVKNFREEMVIGGAPASSEIEQEKPEDSDQEWNDEPAETMSSSSDEEVDSSEAESKPLVSVSSKKLDTSPPPKRAKVAQVTQQQKMKPKPSSSAEDVEFQCPDCPKKYRRKQVLHHHRIFDHGPSSTTSDRFNMKITPNGLTFREFIYKTNAKFQCQAEKCKKKYHTKEELDKHSKIHGKFLCSICGHEGKFAQDLAIHEASHNKSEGNSGEGRFFKCSRCEYKIGRKVMFVDHFLQTHLGVEGDKIKCPTCEAPFSANRKNKSVIRQFYVHYTSHHGLPPTQDKNGNGNVVPESEQVFKCDQCSAFFLNATQLDKHKRTSHRPGVNAGLDTRKRHRCQDCGEGFKCGSTLLNHRINVHKAETKIPCGEEGCDRMFETILDLQYHKIHAHTGGRPLLQCSVCGKKCVGALKLRRHEALHNEQYLKDSRVTCDLCGKTFKNKETMQVHLLTHSGPESWKFTCEKCGKKCMTKGKLEEHMRTHSKSKPFVCETCGQAYAHRHNLRIHVNNKHEKKDVPRLYNKYNLVSKTKKLKKEDG